MKKIIIGSRGSDLALWQANHVKSQLRQINIDADIKIIKTQGDQIQHLSFDKLEGKGFFTKEIEEALLAKEIDLAVHSHKDLPTTSPEGLMIAAVSDREDPSELLLISPAAVDYTELFSLKKNARLGTSSARRKSQFLSYRPDLSIDELRGNVPTRIQKLRDGKYDAIVLAAAGVERLAINLDEFHVEKIHPTDIIPAPAQGVLALQIRTTDSALYNDLQAMNNQAVLECIQIERKVLNLFDGGCQLPLGVYCKEENETYHVWAAKANTWNDFPVRVYKKYTRPEALQFEQVATDIISQINKPKQHSVFISRTLSSDSFFKRALENKGYSIQAESLIETKTIGFSAIPKTDWVFFSSKNAVKHFFQQNPVLEPTVKYAVIGKGTEIELRKAGQQPHFVGNFLYPHQVGKSFESVIETGQSVLFPQALDSIQSIQKELSFSSKVFDLHVYKTDLKQEVAEVTSDIMVFTSPSNVRAYCQHHTPKENQTIIAIGPSTAKELERFGIKKYILPSSSNEVGLSEAVFSA